MTDQADGPAAFQNLGSAAEQAVGGQQVTAYTPSWSAQGAIQPANPSLKQGYYRVANGWCDVYVYIGFGASSGGGVGALGVGLPVAASASVPFQVIPAWLHIPGIAYAAGVASLNLSATFAFPLFPQHFSTSALGNWRSADDSAAAGTSVPLVSGGYSVQSGGWVTVQGRYLVA